MAEPDRIPIMLALPPQVISYLRALHETGLYGFTLEETAERFICDGIIRAISDRIITKHHAEMGAADGR